MRNGTLVVLGRGVEQVKTLQGLVWRPTRYIEEWTAEGYHTGFRADGIHLNDDKSWTAGANANVLATIELCERLSEENNRPALLIFAAGRPPGYIREKTSEPFCEGQVLMEKFMRKIDPAAIPAETMILGNNKTTKDDILASAKATWERNLKTLVFVTVEVHMPRLKEMIKFFSTKVDDFNGLELHFYTAEDLLDWRYRFHPVWQEIAAKMRTSKAYERTSARERNGIRMLQDGTYKFAP